MAGTLDRVRTSEKKGGGGGGGGGSEGGGTAVGGVGGGAYWGGGGGGSKGEERSVKLGLILLSLIQGGKGKQTSAVVHARQ